MLENRLREAAKYLKASDVRVGAYCPTAYCLLPTANCLLPTASPRQRDLHLEHGTLPRLA